MNTSLAKKGLALFVAGVASANAAHAAVMVFDDRDDFIVALVEAGLDVVEDTFDNEIAGAQVIEFDSGVIAANDQESIFPYDNAVSIYDGNGIYTNSSNHAQPGIPDVATFTFPTHTIGFGFDVFRVAYDGLEVSFNTSMGVQSFLVSDIINNDEAPLTQEGFVGFINDIAFNEIELTNANQLSTDTYDLDNLAFGERPPSEVPVPAALPLMLMGLIGLKLAARREAPSA